jgi:hypothetical protein
MSNYQIPRVDICMADPMPFSQHWEVRIPLSIFDIDLGKALQNSYSQFKPGDLIQVCSYRDKTWSRLTETADFRIVSCNSLKLEAVQITETVKVPAASPEFDPTSKQNLHIVETKGAFEVKDGIGNVIELFVDRQQAEAFIKSYGDITGQPQQEAAAQKAAEDRAGWYVKKSVSGKWTVRNAAGELLREFSSKTEAEEFISPQKTAA